MNVFEHYQQNPAQSSGMNTTEVNQMNNNDSVASSMPLKRTRAKRSCDFCRKRKSRCDADASTPCSNCKAWGYTCEFQTVRKKRGPPSAYVNNLERKCKKMESLLATLTNFSIKDLERNDFQYTGHVAQISSPLLQTDSSSDEEDESDYDPYQQGFAKDYDSIKYTGQSSAGLRLFDNDIFKYQSSIPWPGKENVVLKLMSQDELMIVRTEKSQTTGKSDMLLDIGLSMRAPVFGDSSKLINQSKNTTFSSNPMKPARHQLDKIIGLYFSHLHLIMPIVNKTKFLYQYHRSTTGPPSILMQAVLASAFRFAGRYLPEMVKNATEFGDFYFRKVMKRLRDSSRSRLCHVQAALLMVQYFDMDDGDVESVQWITMGTAIRMAQDLGLHRSCAKWDLPRSEIETRHRVFYACYIMDRWIGARAGKPLTILDREFDTDMPSPYEINEDDNDSNQTGPPTYRSFILLIKLSEILGRIIKSLYAPNAKASNFNAGLDDPTILAVFDRRLKNWKLSLEEPLDGVYLTEMEKANMQIYYYTTVLLLRRPFNNLSPIEFPALRSIVEESESACTEAAKKLSKIVKLRQSKTSNPAYYFVLCTSSSFIYALFQSSLVYLSNALKTRDANDINALHRSIRLIEQHPDVGPALRAVDILKMLASINNLNMIGNTFDISSTPSSAFSSTSSINQGDGFSTNQYDEQEIPKANLFHQRLINTSIVGGITSEMQTSDINLIMSYQGQPSQQKPSMTQMNASDNCYVYQNYPNYSNSMSTSPRQRSTSSDQLVHQQLYSQHSKSVSADNMDYIPSSAFSDTPTTSTHSNSALNSMGVNNLLSNCYNTADNANKRPLFYHQRDNIVSPLATTITQTPQAYTAAYDPNMAVSHSTLPPSSLNWSDWDVYIGHQNQNPSSQT